MEMPSAMDCRETEREGMADHPYHPEGEGLDPPREKYWSSGVMECWSDANNGIVS